jgi:hypothetical protein
MELLAVRHYGNFATKKIECEGCTKLTSGFASNLIRDGPSKRFVCENGWQKKPGRRSVIQRPERFEICEGGMAAATLPTGLLSKGKILYLDDSKRLLVLLKGWVYTESVDDAACMAESRYFVGIGCPKSRYS